MTLAFVVPGLDEATSEKAIAILQNGAADVFLEIITQPFLGFDGIVPGSSNQATV